MMGNNKVSNPMKRKKRRQPGAASNRSGRGPSGVKMSKTMIADLVDILKVYNSLGAVDKYCVEMINENDDDIKFFSKLAEEANNTLHNMVRGDIL